MNPQSPSEVTAVSSYTAALLDSPEQPSARVWQILLRLLRERVTRSFEALKKLGKA
jgi:hypothetical protein